MLPLREYAEKLNRSWEGILDEPENHPRLVVRPPSGLLMVWFMDSNQERPDLVLDLSKSDCAPESLEFWRKKARNGVEWKLNFAGLIKREEFTPTNSSWLLPLGFWDEIPQENLEVLVRMKSAMDSPGIRFTIRHIWVDTENFIAQPISEDAQLKITTECPLGQLEKLFKAMIRQGWIQVGAEKWVQDRFTNSKLKEPVSPDIPLFDWLVASPKLKALALQCEWSTKQIPNHFLLRGKPLKLSTLQSGGHSSDKIHKEAVRKLTNLYKP